MVRYTQTTPEEAAEADVLIIDCFGLLSGINYGDVAYIGGGFGVGIHNAFGGCRMEYAGYLWSEQ